MMGIIDYLIRFSLIRSSIYIAASVVVMTLLNMDVNSLHDPFAYSSMSTWIASNSLQEYINVFKNSFIKSFENNYIFYTFLVGFFSINIDVIIKIATQFREINMPYALNFYNPIKKFEWQDQNLKISHDRFYKSTIFGLFYRNSIAIDLENYEKSKNKIIQYLNLPDNYEIKIIPHGRKGVEIRFFILPTDYTASEDTYKKGFINYGMSQNGIYYIDILKQTHLMCVGESGSGKSNFMHHLLRSIWVNKENIENITLIDLKGTELYRYRHLDNVEFIDDMRGVLDTLKSLKAEMNQRFEEMRQNDEVLYSGKFKFVFIDEVGTVGTYPDKKLRDEIFALLIELFQKGRAAKIIFFLFAQKIDSTNIPSNVLANIQTKVLMKTDSDFNINNTIGLKESIEKITRLDVDSFPKGRAIVKNGDDSEKVLVQIPLMEL